MVSKVGKFFAELKEASRVRKYFSDMPRDERTPLIAYAGTKWKELGFDAPIDVEQTVTHLLGSSLEQVKTLHKDSKEANLLETADVNAEPENAKFMKVFIPEGFSPVQALLVLRDVSTTESLNLVAINVDSGDYVPISPRVVASLLMTAAEQMNAAQDEIEQTAQGH
jgi:hypothetical protein